MWKQLAVAASLAAAPAPVSVMLADGGLVIAGKLTLSFIAGKFTGWTVDEGGDASLRTVKGIALGTGRRALATAYPPLEVDDDDLAPMPSWPRTCVLGCRPASRQQRSVRSTPGRRASLASSA